MEVLKDSTNSKSYAKPRLGIDFEVFLAVKTHRCAHAREPIDGATREGMGTSMWNARQSLWVRVGARNIALGGRRSRYGDQNQEHIYSTGNKLFSKN